MRTFIKWQGNKSKHINKFIQYIPEFVGTYIEPFVGSGALLLKLQPKKFIINDLNKDLINIWNQVKNNPNDIKNIFIKFDLDFRSLSKNDKIVYCRKITSEIELLPYNLQRATDYLLMKFCVYMGEIIHNNKFYFSSLDIYLYLKDKYPFLQNSYYDNLNTVSLFLNNGKIFNQSYEQILNKAKHGDFVFLDPPYIETKKYIFNYNKDEILDESFIIELYNQVKKLDLKNVKWLMTQADTIQIRQIFKEYIIKTFSVYRMASKTYINELLIMNYII